CDPAVTARTQEIAQRAGEASWRLEQDDRSRFEGEGGQALTPAASGSREEPFEDEAVGRQTRDDERTDGRGGAGDHVDGNAGLEARGHDAVSRIGDAGHPGIGDDGNVRALLQPLKQLPDAFFFVSLEEREETGSDAEPLQ